MENESEYARFKAHPADFTRASPLSFGVVVSSILHLFKESVEYNMQTLLPALNVCPVSGSAFTQARYKVLAEVFEELCTLCEQAYEASDRERWKGYRLLAGDGSTLNLPVSRDIEAYFGVHSVTKAGVKRYVARTLFLYDVLNDFVVRGKVSPFSTGEKPLLMDSLEGLSPDQSILILDRGFGNFCTLRELADQQRLFCVRLSVKNSNFAKQALAYPQDDFITTWEPSDREKYNSRNNGIEPRPMKVRVTKILLDSGEIELLVTNLYDFTTITSEDLRELYHLRWGVEEGFKNLKPKMKIEHFGCKKTQGIFQEFYAHIFCMNLIALTGQLANGAIATQTTHRKYRYKYNWKNAYRFVRNKLSAFLTMSSIDAWLDELIAQISASIIPIKPGRHFIRDMVSLKKHRITQFYK